MNDELPDHDELLDDALYRDVDERDDEERADSDMTPESWEE